MHESKEHAALVELFRVHPELATWLAEHVGGLALPAGHTSRTAEPNFKLINLSADALTMVQDQDALDVLALPIEIQRAVKKAKLFIWPAYQWVGRAQLGCKTRVLVIATTREVATWARQTIADGEDNMTTVLVIGPDDVPRITAAATAIAFPALAVLSAALHADGPDGIAVARAAVAALRGLSPTIARRYNHLVFHKLSPEDLTRLQTENPMNAPYLRPDIDDDDPPDQYSEYWLNFMAEKAAEVTAQITAQVTAQVTAEVTARVTAAETLRTRVELLLRTLERRGLAIDADTRVRVFASTDTAELDAWIDRAITATSAADVFA
jgi:hypothetical protein